MTSLTACLPIKEKLNSFTSVQSIIFLFEICEIIENAMKVLPYD